MYVENKWACKRKEEDNGQKDKENSERSEKRTEGSFKPIDRR